MTTNFMPVPSSCDLQSVRSSVATSRGFETQAAGAYVAEQGRKHTRHRPLLELEAGQRLIHGGVSLLPHKGHVRRAKWNVLLPTGAVVGRPVLGDTHGLRQNHLRSVGYRYTQAAHARANGKTVHCDLMPTQHQQEHNEPDATVQ